MNEVTPPVNTRVRYADGRVVALDLILVEVDSSGIAVWTNVQPFDPFGVAATEIAELPAMTTVRLDSVGYQPKRPRITPLAALGLVFCGVLVGLLLTLTVLQR